MIRAAVVGAAGFTGGELIRLLLQHPRVSELTCISASQAGKKIGAVHGDLFWSSLHFAEGLDPAGVDVIFLCGGHGQSQALMHTHQLGPTAATIIDLSQDFRLASPEHPFVYGLPEAFGPAIAAASRIANPGCFATAIQLALLPLAKSQLLQNTVHVTALTGSTGAGQKLQDTTHFTWRANNVSVYKAFSHQHLPEIRQTLESLQAGELPEIHFVPMRADFPRGIFCSLYTVCEGSEEALIDLYDRTYAGCSFVHRSDTEIDLKQVVSTNHALLHVQKHGAHLHVCLAIDNLLKGAAGQAVQNMNLRFERPETEGLLLKPLAY